LEITIYSTRFNEYLIDRSLPAKIREDITWRQTFLNILLDYNNLKVSEPESVKVSTGAYKEDSNEVEAWCRDNIQFDSNGYLDQKHLYEKYFQSDRVGYKVKGKVKNEVEKYIKKNFPTLNAEAKHLTFSNKNFNGWIGISLK
jgi:hypothetical protein